MNEPRSAELANIIAQDDTANAAYRLGLKDGAAQASAAPPDEGRHHIGDGCMAEPDEGLDVDRLWLILENMGVIENGTWVSFQRADAEKIAAEYRALAADTEAGQ